MTGESRVIERFWELAREANEADGQPHAYSLTPWLQAIVSHVQQHPDLRSDFTKAFIQLAHDYDMSPEILGYCMHLLRWTEVKAHIVSWLALEPDERVRHILRDWIAAFEDDWDGWDLYEDATRGRQ